jgi:hypothetical protein
MPLFTCGAELKGPEEHDQRLFTYIFEASQIGDCQNDLKSVLQMAIIWYECFCLKKDSNYREMTRCSCYKPQCATSGDVNTICRGLSVEESYVSLRVSLVFPINEYLCTLQRWQGVYQSSPQPRWTEVRNLSAMYRSYNDTFCFMLAVYQRSTAEP